MRSQPEPKLQEYYSQVRSKLTSATPWQDPDRLVSAKIDVEGLAKVDWESNTNLVASVSGNTANIKTRFDDQALQRKLKHVCRINKASGREAGLWLYQSGAGGAGIIDLNLDGWPDVYLTTIDGNPKALDSGANRLYLNVDGQFIDVSDLAGAGDRGFSQGVTVGDYNADGFDDLVVGNIGRNRIFQNNGDGTFSDVTERCGLSGEDWTTSVLVVDIDSDGNADLFEVGYCGGESLTQPCIDQELGEARSCKPMAFPAVGDRVWRGRGDGTFEEVTEKWLGQHQPGRGFTVTAGNFDDVAGIDLYVANDMTANHFWSRLRDGDFKLQDQGVVRGIAHDNRSLSQASMGLAVGDADNDGDIDFYSTHFTNEYNTYYEQVSAGMWVDRTKQVGLAEPTEMMLGYGAQFFDADNDGDNELMVANGNIDEFPGKAFRMPMQMFRRGQRGRWNPIGGRELGDYFSTKRLGRSLVTFDANRDGLVDALVTHLFDPVALLINRSETEYSSINVFLTATEGHPSAVGAILRGQTDDGRIQKQLIIGTGYQGASERCLHLGLGSAKQIRDVTVIWPSGREESFGTLESGTEQLLIEGSGQPFQR